MNYLVDVDVNDDEEEEDFVPDDFDEEEEGVDFVHHDDDEDDPEGFPSILQGQIYMDERKRICYEQDEAFYLVCKNSFPTKAFTLEAPVIDSPLIFVGWIQDPSRSMEFEVVFSKELMSKDPLQIQFLEAQDAILLCKGSSKRMKTDTKYVDDTLMKKKSGNLRKTSLSYSLKKSSANIKDPTRKSKSEVLSSTMKTGNEMEIDERKLSHLKSSSLARASDVAEIDTKCAHQDLIFVVSGSQIGNSPTDCPRISFRGAYRCPSKPFVGRLHLICPIQILDSSTSPSFAGATGTVASARKKRTRSTIDDDEHVEGSEGVGYQELIDLHDDSRLSTEELRNRYYGSGEKYGNYPVDSKRPKAINNEDCKKKDIEDEDDDDAYGF